MDTASSFFMWVRCVAPPAALGAAKFMDRTVPTSFSKYTVPRFISKNFQFLITVGDLRDLRDPGTSPV